MEYIYLVSQTEWQKRQARFDSMRKYTIYVLELENGKYYVGISKNVEARFAQHISGDGAEWTKRFKPIRLIYKVKTGHASKEKAEKLESDETIAVMKKYGRQNVRGGEYVAEDQGIIDSLLGEELCKEIDKAFAVNRMDRRRKEIRERIALEKKRERDVENQKRFSTYRLKIYDYNTKFSDAQKSRRIANRIGEIPCFVDHEAREIQIHCKEADRNGEFIAEYFKVG